MNHVFHNFILMSKREVIKMYSYTKTFVVLSTPLKLLFIILSVHFDMNTNEKENIKTTI